MKSYKGPKMTVLDRICVTLLVILVAMSIGWAIWKCATVRTVAMDKTMPSIAASIPTPSLYLQARAVNTLVADTPSAEPEPEKPAVPTLTYIGRLQIYGYTPTCKHCCGKADGVTASGVVAEIGRTVAMKGYPFGTEIYIDGLGYFIVEDRGVGAGIVDVACESHKACYALTGRYNVYLVERMSSDEQKSIPAVSAG